MPIQAIGYHPELVESYIITLAMQNHFVYVSRAQRALLCLLLMMFALTVNGQTYGMRVGQTKFIGIDPPIRNAVITQAQWGCDNINVSLTDKSTAGAIVEVTHYFERHATITVFMQYMWYDNRNFPHVGSMEKFILIECYAASATLNAYSLRMKPGETFQLTVKATSGYGPFPEKWSTSNPSVATINSNGKVSARNPGNAIITCDPIVGPPVSCSVEVYQPVSPPGGGGSEGGSPGGSGSGNDDDDDDDDDDDGVDDGSGKDPDDPDDDSEFQNAMQESKRRLNALYEKSKDFIDNNRIQ